MNGDFDNLKLIFFCNFIGIEDNEVSEFGKYLSLMVVFMIQIWDCRVSIQEMFQMIEIELLME